MRFALATPETTRCPQLVTAFPWDGEVNVEPGLRRLGKALHGLAVFLLDLRLIQKHDQKGKNTFSVTLMQQKPPVKRGGELEFEHRCLEGNFDLRAFPFVR